MNVDPTPEHTARKQGDDKDLHPEVIAAYRYVESVLDFADVPSSKIGGPLWFGWALREAFLAGCSHAARAYLAQPEPEGPTDDELLNLGNDVMGDCLPCDPDLLIAFARAALARWGRPAIKPVPVPVSERLPGLEDCDAEGRCWFFRVAMDGVGDWYQRKPFVTGRAYSPFRFTHWLPHHALPVPQP
jgi:hypothetical protein